MKKKILLLLLCIITFTNCDNKTQSIIDNSIQVDINLEEINQIELLPYIDSIQYIKLETTSDDNALISNINKIILDENQNIYIHDNLNKIFTFNDRGILKYVIDRKGQGPEEYIKINNFSLNENKNRIEILDLSKKKIVCYNLSDGSFLEAFDLHQFAYSIFPIEDNAYLADLPMDLDVSGKFGVFLLDSLFRKDKSLLQYSGKYPLFGQDFGVFSEINKNEYGIYSQIDNAVYHFANNCLTKKYRFNFKDRTSIHSLHGQDRFDMSESEKERIATVVFYKETNSLILFNITDKGLVKFILYDKMKNIGQTFFPSDRSHVFISPIKTDTKNVMISVFYSDVIMELFEYYKNNENGLTPVLYEMMNITKEEDNPIIQIIHLKQ